MSIPSPLFNCQQATLLIERQADEVLPLKTQVQLWAHLRLCPYCRRYARQSPFLARQARAAAEHRLPADVVLPAAARQRIQRALDQQLGR
jgi:predicted anti-sigma-YlaC factor YlaD